jgi:hypothetical protein
LDDPTTVTVDSSGDLYIADADNNRVVEVPAATGNQWGIPMSAGYIYAIAGGSSGCADGTPAATSSCLNHPEQASFGPGGNLYIADDNNDAVREVAEGVTGGIGPTPLLWAGQY